MISVPIWALPRVSLTLCASSSGFSAVSLKTENDTFCHGQCRQAPLKGEATRTAVLGPLQSAVASVMDQDSLVLCYVRRTKRPQTASRKAERDIIMLVDFCGLLVGLRICSAICKCYDFVVQLF